MLKERLLGRGIAALAMLAAMGALPAEAACKSEGAIYHMVGAEGFELRLVRAKEPMAWSDLEIVVVTPAETIAYELTASNGYSMNYMVRKDGQGSDDDSMRLYGFGEGMTSTPLPSSTTVAPTLIFTPDLGLALWYTAGERQFLPPELWRLQNCPS